MKRVITFSFCVFAILALSFSSFAQNFSTNPNPSSETYGQVQMLDIGLQTITHSVNPDSVVAGTGVACTAGGITSDNQYWRAFVLADFGITEEFNVTMVEFGIETATAGSGGQQPMTVNLYTTDLVFPTGTLTLIGTLDVMVPDQALTLYQIPVTGTAPAGSELVVEISIPDATGGENHTFYPGANSLGETADSWISSAGCGLTTPLTYTDLGFPTVHLVMSVTGEVTIFSDDFEAYTAGVQLVAQNNVDWDTWSGGGGTGEDPFVSDLFSYSGSNSIVEIPGNDFIRRHGDLTTGKWYISFLFYIPTGQSGYFNTMSGFDGGFEWAMEVNFDVGGTGQVDTSGSLTGNTVDFTWAVAQWNQAVLVVDLDAVPPLAEFWTGTGPGTFRQIAAWDYTQGGTILTQLAVNDFYGGTSTDEMYIDDYYFGDTLPEIIPVELTSFAANVNNNGDVILNWSTATELNNQMFEIERRSEEGQYLKIGYVDGHGTTTEAQEYSYIDNTVETGTFFYRLKQIDFLGTYEYSDEIEVEVNGPLTFELGQNYPNPFNPSTNINYSIPESGIVKLAIYNMLGEEVDVLVDGMVEAGFYEVSFDASNLPSGAYFYRLQSDKLNQVKKMLLLK